MKRASETALGRIEPVLELKFHEIEIPVDLRAIDACIL